ncbi:Fis family transcriptional regulator [Alsobacter soli]|uniref:Fis family transcriptional regulator n=1 Tax=Alsobacter soli TaxID=2109933 RepID=A0A2T1HLW1_9HYPH|nr:sigma-54 dependent transcriptional regulator [Alsobacter soli]PSC02645.1 Fis family transcriptional regulator [Alsobacter soli]
MTGARCVAFVDDDEDLRTANVQSLDLAGFEVIPFASAQEALDRLDSEFEGVVVTDVRMPVIDGITLFRTLRRMDPELPVILITGHGDVPMAVEAMRDGVYDFLAKPYPADRLVSTVSRALEKRALVLENRRLQEQLEDARRGDVTLLGETPAMQGIRAAIRDLADTDVDVLVEGETGTGKEVVAAALHRWSARRARPFVALNCGALPESVIESELFGHEAGAFTGAQKRRVGKIEHADGGTLFLDEIESMPLSLQVKLLRVLQERCIEPLGSNEVRPVNLRVVAATKVDLEQAAARGEFRADLYYRLNVVRLALPPLRERREDIPLLFAHFLAQAAQRFRRPAPPLTPALTARLAERDWPGNVRELAHTADRFLLGLEPGLAGTPARPQAGPADPAPTSLAERVDAYEARLIREALDHLKGDVRAAAETLGIARKTLYDKLNRYGIDPAGFR